MKGLQEELSLNKFPGQKLDLQASDLNKLRGKEYAAWLSIHLTFCIGLMNNVLVAN
jgi:hypothetical protein